MGAPRTWHLAERRRRTKRRRDRMVGLTRALRRRAWKAASKVKRRFIVRMIHSLSPRWLWHAITRGQ